MIIQRVEDVFLVKVFKEYLPDDFDIMERENISDLFQEILLKLKKKYQISGLLDVEVYMNQDYGMIMEIENVFDLDYSDEIDVSIHMHLDSIFLMEVEIEDVKNQQEIYYCNGKFYEIYHGLQDSNVIYKDCLALIEKGIRVC